MLLMADTGGGADKLYVDSLFSTYLYTGNGSTQTINNGIDLAGEGGLVWEKLRTASAHVLTDTARGIQKYLMTDSTSAETNGGTATGVQQFNNNGFSSTPYGSGASVVSWTFRKAPKFFDIVTYTGDGTSDRTFNHDLGMSPGFIIIKRTSGTSNWYVWHRSLPSSRGYLDLTDAFYAGSGTSVTGTTFTTTGTASSYNLNLAGSTYVAYLFAHDTATDGLIQCGVLNAVSSFTDVTLGWEPQFVIAKRIDSSTSGAWFIEDTMRGMPWDAGTTAGLAANSSAAETVAYNESSPRSNGFKFLANSTGGGAYYIYLAIRRPNKPPTSGTQVYNAIARTGTSNNVSVTGVGFTPDTVLTKMKTGDITTSAQLNDRLRGVLRHLDWGNGIEDTAQTDTLKTFDMNGVSFGADANTSSMNYSGNTYINWFLKRAVGVYDYICYTGTGANKTEAHGLGVAPELWFVEKRSGSGNSCGSSLLDATEYLNKATNAAKATDATMWNSTYPTASVISLGASVSVNASGSTYILRMFATLAGISKVFSYIGNGTSQTINCGFSAGARFILIKCTSATGSWFVWDTVRGIIAAEDPHLSLEVSAAQITTDDSIDPDTSGFIVNQVAATNINVNGATYIGLAIA